MRRRVGLGAALALAVAIGVSSAAAAQESVLYRFKDGRDGAYPTTGLIIDGQGTLYGTTSGGGFGYGTVFALTPPAAGQIRWGETVLYRFQGSAARDGARPQAGLIMDAHGIV